MASIWRQQRPSSAMFFASKTSRRKLQKNEEQVLQELLYTGTDQKFKTMRKKIRIKQFEISHKIYPELKYT